MYTLQDATNEFMHHCTYEKNLSPHTIRAYRSDLTQLQEFLEKRNYSLEIRKVTKKELTEYLESISVLKTKSVRRKMTAIKVMFEYLEDVEKIKSHPFRKIRLKIKEPKNLPRVLDLEEIRKIIECAYA